MTAPIRPLGAGIFAAGVGARLRPAQGSAETPKGLIQVGGRPLIAGVLAAFDEAGVAETVVIINEQSTAVRDYVDRHAPRHPVRWIVETTPSSMHSFLRVIEELARDGQEGPFLLSTVDTVVPPGTFRTFVDAAARIPRSDLVLALTTFIDDENPLRIDIRPDADDGAEVTAVGSGAYATAGCYLVSASVLGEAAAGRAANFGALRVFFRHLFDRGYRLSGVCVGDSVDVDRPSDIAAAERLLQRPS
jgi:NDP-sugar pyrophosphorylase family protein